MMFDIKSKLSKILGIKNFVVLDESFNIQDLLVSYLFRTKGEINFKTNDTNLFSQLPKVSDKDYTNIINTEKNYEFSDNIIYYIPNLNKNNLFDEELVKSENELFQSRRKAINSEIKSKKASIDKANKNLKNLKNL